MNIPNNQPSAQYAVYQFRDNLYKIIKYKTYRKGAKFNVHRRQDGTKFSTSISRTRSTVLDILLSNHWQYFITCTLSSEKGDRFDLDSFHKKISQFFRNQSKKYNQKFEYLLIPEPHKNGAYHFHGVVNCPEIALSKFTGNVPYKLKQDGYYNWIDYQKSFGFCSLSVIKDEIACSFYILKYITKNTLYRKEDFGKHLYYASQGLKRKKFIAFGYGEQPILDKYLTFENKYCASGVAQLPFEVIENEESNLCADLYIVNDNACIGF